ncbi:MAG: hypothetical protein JWO98_1987 [Frankiales bacterium]|nr:hypothetical protein [Frankiales bacterium]
MPSTVRASDDPARDVADPLADYEPRGEPLPPPVVPPSSPQPTGTDVPEDADAAGDDATPVEEAPAGPREARAATLVTMTKTNFDIGQADGATVVVPRGAVTTGNFALPPNIALPLRGRGGLAQHLRLLWDDARLGSVPSATALTDALSTVEALGTRSEEIKLHRRVAHLPTKRQVVVDLGTRDGAAVVVTPGGWRVVAPDACPVIFQRSPLARAHPLPAVHKVTAADCAKVLADLALLRRYVNVTDADWPLLVGWLVATHLTGPTPVLLLTGEAGTGKSSAARAVIDLIDPQEAPLRQVPRDEDQLTIASLGTAAFAWDNVSKLPVWLSDALCQLVTGHGRVVRQLYTDTGTVPTWMRRSVVMTSIDAGTLRGDLATRLLPLELTPLRQRRRGEADLDVTWAADRPRILAALLTLLSRVLGQLGEAPLSSAHRQLRMSDFAGVLAALDLVTDVPGADGQSLTTYAESQVDVQITVAEGDRLASAIKGLVDDRQDGQWSGTWTQFLTAVASSRDPHDKEWPTTGQQASGRVKGLATALVALGITAQSGKSNGVRKVTFTATAPTEPDSDTAPLPFPLEPF